MLNDFLNAMTLFLCIKLRNYDLLYNRLKKKKYPPTYPKFSVRVGSGESEIFLIMAYALYIKLVFLLYLGHETVVSNKMNNWDLPRFSVAFNDYGRVINTHPLPIVHEGM